MPRTTINVQVRHNRRVDSNPGAATQPEECTGELRMTVVRTLGTIL